MLTLKDIHKRYQMGDTELHVLRGVSLTIEDGDFVAIMGPSGSGKSTLMHILGLLDVPDQGSYQLNGQEVSALSEDQLALLRRSTIGFIFQQFHLLPRMSALENVALPMLYSHHDMDMALAKELLERTGLGQRIMHAPNELSGGQQQRVAIARSLINKPSILFADEPTGNLDSKSGKEILDILREFNRRGITIVLVTHEESIGRQANRLIRIQDGLIVSDERTKPLSVRDESISVRGESNPVRGELVEPPLCPSTGSGRTAEDEDDYSISDIIDYFKQGFRTLAANKVRSGLSMLGILIGVAAVVAMLALGHGAQKAIEAQLASLGSNLLSMRPGAYRVGGVALDTGAVTRLTLDDANAILEQVPDVVATSPAVSGRGQVTYMDKNWSTQLQGVDTSYARMHASEPDVGRFFTPEENLQRKRVAVIGTTVADQLFGTRDPMGEMIKINKVNFQVIGLLPHKGATSFRDQDDVIIIPLLTAMHRLLGKDYVDSIDTEVVEGGDTNAAQKDLMKLMLDRHRVPISQRQDAFQIRNMADIQAAMAESSRTMSLLLACIAAISLLVGGIGIMNIMLVSVTERTREIGLRKAIGARRWDILLQFLAEAIVVSVVGGFAGIALGWMITKLLSLLAGWATAMSLWSVLLASFFSITIGIVFGIYPAKKASRLNPIDALRYE